MEKVDVIAIVDIGKTNKKFYLFDETTGEVLEKSSTRFDEIQDDDGFPSDDLSGIEKWVKKEVLDALSNSLYRVKKMNFSGYGASLVYLDGDGKRVPVFYNYLKPYPDDIIDQFFSKYGPQQRFCTETSSPYLGMLNSGLQLYWLKYAKPDIFKRVRYVLHFPQYLSYIFSGKPISEYTSIGCHTGLWDFTKGDYHLWVYKEGLVELFPPIVHSDTEEMVDISGYKVKVGRGLHDSSASLIPYLKSESEPFLLLSTGTWSICLNPYSNDQLSENDLARDCLNLLRIDGGQVRVARLFLGKEYEELEEKICQKYSVSRKEVQKLEWDIKLFRVMSSVSPVKFKLNYLAEVATVDNVKDRLEHQTYSWELEYYQMMNQLTDLQIEAIKLASGTNMPGKIIIEGGFISNQVFVEMLRLKMPELDVQVSQLPSGSARGVFEMCNSI